jgi:hypothetical protein
MINNLLIFLYLKESMFTSNDDLCSFNCSNSTLNYKSGRHSIANQIMNFFEDVPARDIFI